MKLVTKSLLYYSLILSLAFFVVGIVTSRGGNGIIMNLFYLPTLLYLAYLSINSKDFELREKKDSALMAAVVIFVVLFLVGVFNIYNFQQNINKQETMETMSPIIIQNHEKNP